MKIPIQGSQQIIQPYSKHKFPLYIVHYHAYKIKTLIKQTVLQ